MRFHHIDRCNAKSTSLGVNAGVSSRQQRDRAENESARSTVSIDFADERANRKTKTPGTIGKGNIEVASVDKSNTRMLNRDIKNGTVDIYNIKSHKGLKGSLDTRLLTKDGRKQVGKEFREFSRNMQIVAQRLPSSKDKPKIIAIVGEILDTLSKYTGGLVPSHGMNGGVLGNIPILAGSPDINFNASPKPGAYDGQNIYVNGILNTKGDARKGADNIIGKNQGKTWWNPTHGAIADLLESAVDILNGIGLQTGISKQIEQLQQINHNLKIYMHSQGNLVTAEGARHTKNNGHEYFSFGAPMSDRSIKKTFSSADVGKGLKVKQKNEGDYVAHPLNIFKPSTWDKPGHGTENYGAAKAAREAKAARRAAP